MLIDKYGVRFSRIGPEDLELVRMWRNDPKIVQYMEYREYITPEMQEKWFEGIDNDSNFYFIFGVADAKIGLINIKNIDYEAGFGEGGIFVYDDRYLNSTLPFFATLTLSDFVFYDLKLGAILAHIMKSNTRAIRYNLRFGYRLQPNQESVENQLYVQGLGDYEANKPIILRMLGSDRYA